uniref:Hexamerin storage protein 3 n=1 Tax=Romalea microptera TaxID=7007 RepID=Q56DL4_ROMMI|nr:hexamerin storage protein 3 [Romalea microptera]
MHGVAVAVAILALAAVAAAVPTQPVAEEADEVMLMRQKDIIRLLNHYRQKPLWEDMAAIARDYTLQPENYQVPHLIDDFVMRERHREFLPLFQPVSMFDERHVEQIKLFFDLLYHAKDYDTFYKTALYLRERVNKDLFMAAFLMAVRVRQDTKDMVLPPLYEIYPEFFITSDVMQRAYDARLEGYATTDGKPFYILANYTGYPTAHTPEQKLSYFTEDVGLNEFFADFNYRYPYFLRAANYTMINGKIRGDVFYHTLRNLFARYLVERLSHGLPDVTPINYDKLTQTGYYPQIRLHNGVEFPIRPAGQSILEADAFALERIWFSEYRLYEAIDMGLAISAIDGRMRYKPSEATNMLGNLVQSTADSIHPRYYGAVYRDLLSLFGKYLDPTQRYGLAASVLGKYETMLRDPVYFQIVKRILNVFQHYQNYLEPYTVRELEFPGLRIESVDVDKLVTYFENFDIEVDNSLRVSNAEEAEKVKIFARQPQLNHKPFTYRIKVSSEKPSKAIFRVFYGPRYDSNGNEMSLDDARQYFVEFDRFVYEVQAGENEIARSSRDFVSVRPSAMSTQELVTAMNDALQGKRAFRPATTSRRAFPERLLLPRGSRTGLPLRFYVIASPLAPNATAASVDPQAPLTSEWFTALADGRPVAFPFDRRIPHYYRFRVPNSYIQDVVVYHKTIDEINRPAA